MADTPTKAPESQEPTFLDELKRHMGELQEEEVQRRHVWELVQNGRAKITSEGEANLVAAEFVKAEEEIERVQIMAENRISRAKRRYQSIEFVFKGPLEQWAAKNIKGKKKSITLEDAQLAFRTVKATVRTVNELNLTEWAEASYVECVKYAPKVSLAMVSDWEAKHKKLAPGREAIDERETFNVKRLKKGGE